MNTFVEGLNRLNSQGFLSGLVQVGQAVKEQKQNSTLVDLYNQYKTKSANLLNTTDQQIGDINAQASKQGNQNDPLVDAANVSTKFAMAAFNSLNRIKQLNELSGSIVPIMMTLGEDGFRMAQSISKEIDQYKATEEAKIKIPVMAQEFKLRYVQIEAGILNTKVNQLNYDTAIKDFNEKEGTKKLLASMLQSSEGKELMAYASGMKAVGNVLRDDPNVDKVNKAFYAKFSNMPNFQPALSLMMSNSKFYRLSVMLPSGSSNTSTTEIADGKFINRVAELKDATGLWDNVHGSNDYPFDKVRAIISNTATDDQRAMWMDDDQIKMLVKDYTETFLTASPKNYHTIFNEVKSYAASKGKRFGEEDVPLSDGTIISWRDFVKFNKSRQVVYEPRLYRSGYYKMQDDVKKGNNPFSETLKQRPKVD